MEERVFAALLERYPAKRARDFVGASTAPLSLEAARAHREQLRAAAAEQGSRPQARAKGPSASFLRGAPAFERLREEMQAQGVRNAAQVAEHMKGVYTDWVCTLNLEELEQMLASHKVA